MPMILWHNILNYGNAHGVSPILFALLYVAHHPLFWGTVAWIAARLRKKRPVIGLVVLAIFFWVMPYGYVLAFGRGLPIGAYAAAGLLLLVGGIHAGWQVQKKFRRRNPSSP